MLNDTDTFSRYQFFLMPVPKLFLRHQFVAIPVYFHLGRSLNLGRSYLGRSYLGRSHSGRSHSGRSHSCASYLGSSHSAVFTQPVFTWPVLSRALLTRPVFTRPVFIQLVFTQAVFIRPVSTKWVPLDSQSFSQCPFNQFSPSPFLLSRIQC